MFISPAYAQTSVPGAGFDVMQFLPLVLIFVVFYFLLIRPQQKKAKQHRELLSSIKRGDRVVTAGGIIGTVSKVEGDAELVVEIAKGVEVKVIRQTVTDVLAKPGPVVKTAEKPVADKPAVAEKPVAEKPVAEKVEPDAPKV
jgi:preprotein translocase subunit YajC